jgi:broad specificity phosphatase PhoE
MQPKRIIIGRHAESIGNADQTKYNEMPHYKLPLTLKGEKQAYQAGQELAEIIGNGSIQCYCSPLVRTRDTWKIMQTQLLNSKISTLEDPRLRTQEWGPPISMEANEILVKERILYGMYFYHIPGGEFCAHVHDRVLGFVETMYRHFERDNFAENVVIVSHGMTLRLVLMSLLDWTYNEFEQYANTNNCELIILELENDKYVLKTELKKR